MLARFGLRYQDVHVCYALCPNLGDPVDAIDEEAIDARLFELGAAISDGFGGVGRGITELLLAEIPELRGDEIVEGLLNASVEENVGAMLSLLGLRVPVEGIAVPGAAAEYARRLAQRGVSVIPLVRAYRLGHASFLDWSLEQLAAQEKDQAMSQAITRRVMRLSFDYIDRVSEQVVTAYQSERDRWLLTQTAVRASRVRKLLAGDEVDVSALGYRLAQFHVAVIGWVPEPTKAGEGLVRLDRVGQTLATELGCTGRPLFVPFDEAVAWFWLPFGTRPEVHWSKLEVAGIDPTAHVAVGELGQGTDGFRTSHQQAAVARRVALTARPPHRVTLSERIGPIALMCGELDATRAWVRKVLGQLGTDEKNNAVLRETLRVFLEHGGSYSTAAETLSLHRNTVQYRLNKAAELLPGPITERRADLELALRACDQLGSTVLAEG